MNGPTYTGMRITNLRRTTNSVNGNPAYFISLTFPDGKEYTYRTMSDAGFCYDIENREYHENPVTVELTRAGRIRNIDIEKGN